MTTPGTPPQVLISHAHHDELHEKRVLKLYRSLRNVNINANIDFVDRHNRPWSEWMMDQIDNAHFVLIVCTEEYLRKSKEKNAAAGGHGVFYEMTLVRNDVYFEKFENSKFIPIVFYEQDRKFIPKLFRDYTSYCVNIDLGDLKLDKGFEELYRKIKNVPKHAPSELGEDWNLEENVEVKKLAILLQKQEDWSASEDIERARQNVESFLSKVRRDIEFQFEFSQVNDNSDFNKILTTLFPAALHYLAEAGAPLFPFQEDDDLERIVNDKSYKTNCLVIENYSPNSQEEQVKMLIRYIEYVIGLPGTLDQEKTNHFLSKFYEEFFMEKPANLAFIHGAKVLGEDLLQSADSPVLITQKNNEMVQYKGLEQIKELEKEMEKLVQEETFLDSQISVYKTKYLEGNPYKAMILWLTNYQKQFLADIGAEFFNSYQISNKEDFLLELEFLIERLITCLYTKRLNIVFKENLKTMRISNPSLFYQVALSKLDIEIEKAKVDENSKSFFRSAVDKLFKELAG